MTHVVWDWNGTLWDDTQLCIAIMNEMLRERGMPALDRARYQQIFDFPVIRYYERLGFDFKAEPFAVVGAEFIRRYELRRLEATLHPPARPTLQALRELGLQQSVLSAYRHETLEELLISAGIRDFFMGVLGSDNVYAEGKVTQGRQWIKHLGVSPDRVVLIGDTEHDFDVATAMGCPCLLVAAGYHPRTRLEKLGAPVLDSLDQIPGWLSGFLTAAARNPDMPKSKCQLSQ